MNKETDGTKFLTEFKKEGSISSFPIGLLDY